MIIVNMIPTWNFTKQSHAKNRIEYHNAGGHPKCDEFIIKTGTTEMGFHFNQADMWFTSKSSPVRSFVFSNVLFEF